MIKWSNIDGSSRLNSALGNEIERTLAVGQLPVAEESLPLEGKGFIFGMSNDIDAALDDNKDNDTRSLNTTPQNKSIYEPVSFHMRPEAENRKQGGEWGKNGSPFFSCNL